MNLGEPSFNTSSAALSVVGWFGDRVKTIAILLREMDGQEREMGCYFGWLS
jgi:hypothetical protein